MKSRNIFVTGGMGGIGKACVQKFINQGDKVVFTYAQEKSNEIEAEKFAKTLGPEATSIAIDMSDPTSIRGALEQSQSTMGSIDTLINAAAVGSAASALFAGLIDAVVIGADRIARNGDTANKIGSLGLAIAAQAANVPFLVIAPESTIDRSIADGSQIEIEFRADSEVTHFAGLPVAPVGAKSYNPAFDVTLSKFITAIITEKQLYHVSEGVEL